MNTTYEHLRLNESIFIINLNSSLIGFTIFIHYYCTDNVFELTTWIECEQFMKDKYLKSAHFNAEHIIKHFRTQSAEFNKMEEFDSRLF